MDSERLVSIASFTSEAEAQLASAKLERLGIASTLIHANANWLYSNAIGDVELQVRSADAEAAQAALAEAESGDALEEDAEAGEAAEDESEPD